MLRALVLVLLLANAAFLAWTQGWLDVVVGPVPTGREPERVQRQIRPEALRLVPDETPAPGDRASGAPR